MRQKVPDYQEDMVLAGSDADVLGWTHGVHIGGSWREWLNENGTAEVSEMVELHRWRLNLVFPLLLYEEKMHLYGNIEALIRFAICS